MKKVLLFCMVLCVAALTAVLQSCGSENDESTNSEDVSRLSRSQDKGLFCKWFIVGYGSDENFTAFNKGFIEIREDGIFEGEIENEFYGEFSLEGENQFVIERCAHSKAYPLDPDVNFLEDLIFDNNWIYVYVLKDNTLRLYYSDTEYISLQM